MNNGNNSNETIWNICKNNISIWFIKIFIRSFDILKLLLIYINFVFFLKTNIKPT